MLQTLRVSFVIGHCVGQDLFACRDEGEQGKPLGSQILNVNALQEYSFPQ